MRRLSLAFLLGLTGLAGTASPTLAAWQRSEFEITSERTDATTTFKQYEQSKQSQPQTQQQQPTQQQPPSAGKDQAQSPPTEGKAQEK